jgi:hypothetical protein
MGIGGYCLGVPLVFFLATRSYHKKELANKKYHTVTVADRLARDRVVILISTYEPQYWCELADDTVTRMQAAPRDMSWR